MTELQCCYARWLYGLQQRHADKSALHIIWISYMVTITAVKEWRQSWKKASESCLMIEHTCDDVISPYLLLQFVTTCSDDFLQIFYVISNIIFVPRMKMNSTTKILRLWILQKSDLSKLSHTVCNLIRNGGAVLTVWFVLWSVCSLLAFWGFFLISSSVL